MQRGTIVDAADVRNDRVRQIEEIADPNLVGAGGFDREASCGADRRNELALGKEFVDGLLAELRADDMMALLRQPDHVEALAAQRHEDLAPAGSSRRCQCLSGPVDSG